MRRSLVQALDVQTAVIHLCVAIDGQLNVFYTFFIQVSTRCVFILSSSLFVELKEYLVPVQHPDCHLIIYDDQRSNEMKSNWQVALRDRGRPRQPLEHRPGTCGKSLNTLSAIAILVNDWKYLRACAHSKKKKHNRKSQWAQELINGRISNVWLCISEAIGNCGQWITGMQWF